MNIKSAYFFIAKHVVYDDSIIYLAEGLKKLGVNIFSNRDYWKESLDTEEFLFKHDSEVNWSDCDVLIYSYAWFNYVDPKTYAVYSERFPSEIFTTNRKYKTVYLDPTDGYRTKSWDEEFRQLDLILRAKFNYRTYNPSNVRPWVLGYSDRIVKATESQLSFEDRRKVILQNFYFTHSYDHGLRTLAIREILPQFEVKYPLDKTVTTKDDKNFSEYDKLMWNQTEEKHQPSYYQLLGTSMANASFCGELIPGLPRDPSVYMKGGNKYRLIKNSYSLLSKLMISSQRIIQWDSWRFWESLVAGCIPIHIDLEKYGVELPVMPENWKHYIGIDLNNIKRDVERFCEDENQLQLIAKKGQEWVFDNYSPIKSAERFLKLLES